MARDSSLDPENVPAHLERDTGRPLDSHLVGPSDSSDTASESLDSKSQFDIADGDDATLAAVDSSENSDREHTGERLTVERESDIQPDADIGFDRIVGADEAGLGDGLDQAEEAQLGITDEELRERARAARKS